MADSGLASQRLSPKYPQILTGLYKENVGHRWVGSAGEQGWSWPLLS